MRRGIVALSVAVLVASAAHAAPGDPRLIQGVLEWPAKLTAEPFVVIRTDDGRWYYTEIKNAKRLESGPLTSGGRVAIRSEEHTSELQSHSDLVCRLLLEKKKRSRNLVYNQSTT